MDKAEAILKKLFGRYVDQDEDGLIGFFSQWQGLVGTDLSAHADPVDIKNGALYLEVDHPAWLQRLHAKQGEILKSIQGRFPNLGIEQIYFRMTKDDAAPRPKGAAVRGQSPEAPPEAAPPETPDGAPKSSAPKTGAPPDQAPEPAPEAEPASGQTREEKFPEDGPPEERSREEKPREHRGPPPPAPTEKEALERLPESNLKRSLERLRDHLNE